MENALITFASIAGVLTIAGAAVMAVALRRAPVGVETAEGFHVVEDRTARRPSSTTCESETLHWTAGRPAQV